jgi:oxygen-independent coproporphyrinogen-3 oxidase
MIAFDAELIRRFDRNGPRYTSYPTADRFVDTFDHASHRKWAAARGHGVGAVRPLALYVHLPFCRDVCFYCACNRIITRDTATTERYLDALAVEIALQAELFRVDPRVVQMHWGGGTPTYYSNETLHALFGRLARHFDFAPDGEYSIEADPRTVSAETVHALRGMGFNRISFGVQDFDPVVQEAIHRPQSEACTLTAIEAARTAGFDSVNIDLIYGLPRQTVASFDQTLSRVTALRPGRIALYSYAHLPGRFAPQRRIAAEQLPPAQEKLQLLDLAIRRFGAAGYVYIGMDHFALPDDALAVAQRRGDLHRNFQGYSTCPEADLVGLGVSAIGAIGPTYSQNYRALDPYYAALDKRQVPVARGIELDADDLLRRAVIQALMCQFAVSKQRLEAAYLIDFDRYFAVELEELRSFEDLGLLVIDDGWIEVTPKGRFVIRGICMVFDRYLRHERGGMRYSAVV